MEQSDLGQILETLEKTPTGIHPGKQTTQENPRNENRMYANKGNPKEEEEEEEE